MFQYSNVYGSSGGGNLWKFVLGASPDDIELNAAAGVTGIDTSVPADPNVVFKLGLIPLFGTNGALLGYFNGTDICALLSGGSPGNGIAMLAAADAGSINVAAVQVQQANYEIQLNSDDTVDQGRMRLQKNFIVKEVSDLTDGTQDVQNKQAYVFVVGQGGVAVTEFYIDLDGFKVADGATSTDSFQVRNTGEIETNQFVPVVPAGAPNGHIPIWDVTTGTVIALIPTVTP